MRQNLTDDLALRHPPVVGEYVDESEAECDQIAGILCAIAGRTGRWEVLIDHLAAIQDRAAAARQAEAQASEQATLEAAQRILDARGSNLKII